MEEIKTRLMTAAEVAEALSLPLSAVYRYTRTGEFADFSVRVGTKYRYRPDGLDRYVNRGMQITQKSGEAVMN